MGGNDRQTRTLSPEEVAKLKQESARQDSDTAFVHAPKLAVDADEHSTEPISWDDLAVPEEPAEAPEDRLIVGGRTTTLQDPLTAALLAEVTREARTQEFDPAELARTLANAEAAPDKRPELAHPKLKRRDG